VSNLRRAAPYVLVLVIGAALGFGFSEARDTDPLPPTPAPTPMLDVDDVVHYETVSSIFPVEGAQFTAPFDNPNDPDAGCDKEKLKASLNADLHRKQAWLLLQGIQDSEFDPFIDRLVSAVLTEPTPFTNHGCFPLGQGDCPFALQSVLAPGTLVLVDPEQDFRPVVRCRCGNPLKPPVCPPNCDDRPTPTPTLTPPPRTQTPPPRVTPTPTPPPTPTPTPTPPPRETPTPTPPGTGPQPPN